MEPVLWEGRGAAEGNEDADEVDEDCGEERHLVSWWLEHWGSKKVDGSVATT